jgi:hypothetical protein
MSPSFDMQSLIRTPSLWANMNFFKVIVTQGVGHNTIAFCMLQIDVTIVDASIVLCVHGNLSKIVYRNNV